MKKLHLKVKENAYVLISQFRREARRAGWTKEQIDAKTRELTAGNYDDLIAKLQEL